MKFVEIIWILAIILSIAAIFSIVPIEIALNALVISIAIFALIWVNIARKNLSRGSSLSKFSSFLFFSITFFLLSSIFQLTIKIVSVSILIWLSYIFLATAYLLLVISAYRLMLIGKEFGFVPETAKIRKLLENKELGKELKDTVKKNIKKRKVK